MKETTPKQFIIKLLKIIIMKRKLKKQQEEKTCKAELNKL